MVEYQRKQSSGVSKAALATAIGAGAVALSNNTGSLLGGLFGNPAQAVRVADTAAASTAVAEAATIIPLVAAAYGGSHRGHSDEYVSKSEMSLIRESTADKATIAKLEAKIYADEKIDSALAPVYGLIKEQDKEICDLKAALGMETDRRECGDKNLLTYINSNFIKAEKSLNSKHINYHGIKPVLKIDECCDCGE